MKEAEGWARRPLRRRHPGRTDEQRADCAEDGRAHRGRRRQGRRGRLGGSRDGGRPTELYYQPTVVDGVGVDTLINRDETFGPIVPITVADDDEALTVANDSHLGLQAAVYTRSLKRAFRYLDNLQVGNVVVNDSTDYWEARAVRRLRYPHRVGSDRSLRCST